MTRKYKKTKRRDIVEKIKKVMEPAKNSNCDTRYRSWEHCYQYFKTHKNGKGKKVDECACINLAFYLASWGMYRGSSFLLRHDYLIHKKAVAQILKNKDLSKDGAHKDIERVSGLVETIKSCYENNNVSDTLATKIILGTLGCLPAYDTFFVEGIKKLFNNNKKEYRGLLTPNKKSIEFLVQFYEDNKKEFEKAKEELKKMKDQDGNPLVRIDYPPMKLVDMYLWQLGGGATSNKQCD